MRPLHELSDRPLRWSKPRLFERRYALHAGDDLAAELRWESFFGSRAVAESAHGRWVFQRTGFLRPRVLVSAADAQGEVASIRAGWWGEGEIEGLEGGSYRWSRLGFWRSSWLFSGEDGAPVVRFERECLRRAAAVRIEPAAAALPDLPLLVCLGWYLLVLRDDDAGGMAAVGAAAAAG